MSAETTTPPIASPTSKEPSPSPDGDKDVLVAAPNVPPDDSLTIEKEGVPSPARSDSREVSPNQDEEEEDEEEDANDDDDGEENEDEEEEEEAYFWHDQIIAELCRACRESDPRNAYTILDTLSADRLGNQSYTAREARTGQKVIVKLTELAPPVERYAGQRIITELFLMRDMLPHPNVGNFLDLYLYDKSELWMMTEYMEGGRTLGEIIANNSSAFTEERIARICLDVCKGLAHLHSQLIIHRDIRSDSIVIDMKGRVKITGFGFSVQLPDKKAKRRTMVSTLNLPTRSPYTVDKTHWTSPEVIRRKEYGPEVDVWAFGITVVEMIDGAPPYVGEEPLKVLFLILVNGTPELKNPDALSDEMKDFLGNCLDVDVECRSTMSELVEHDFLKRACPPVELAPLFEWETDPPAEAEALVASETEETPGDTAVPESLDSAAAEIVASEPPAPETSDPAPPNTADSQTLSEPLESIGSETAAPETLESVAPESSAPSAIVSETLASPAAVSAVPETTTSTAPDSETAVDPSAPSAASAASETVASPGPEATVSAVPDTTTSTAPDSEKVDPPAPSGV
ncbi:kinase-like domain-containing protein [Mycena latifolia]|nr:kinase-like domain-containing protein [Mycena latifolia]